MKKKRIVIYSVIGVILLIVLGIGTILLDEHITEHKEQEELKKEVAVVGREHYLTQNAEQDLAFVKQYQPDKKNQEAYEHLVKTYFVFYTLDQVTIQYDMQKIDGEKVIQKQQFDKENERYFIQTQEKDREKISVFENGTYYYILPDQKQYTEDDTLDFKEHLEFFSSFEMRMTEYLPNIMTILQRGTDFSSEFKDGKFYFKGKVLKEESNALEGEVSFISDEDTGIVQEIVFSREDQVLERIVCKKLDLTPTFAKSFLPDLSAYQKVDKEELAH